ncbi:MAG: hypothetical protein K8W52_00760, partial [Deltaproteobacteria bacterium]|nr:hypothetical protein [Deltaproteobacteria bacterium]
TCATGSACNGTICKGSKQCNDGDNNDTDTFTDYPNDPGCDSPQDDSEADDCPSGPNCPVCSNGADDDDDTFTDYPNDPSCGAASGMSEGCAASEPIGVLTQPTTSATTTGATNDVAPTCGSSSNSAGDMTFSLDVPRMKSLNISTNASFDAVTVMLDSSCTGSEIACEDFSDIALGATPAGRYYVIVDGWSSGTGTFDLTVSGQIVAGQSCESALAQSGALTCTAGFACSGMPGSRTCQVAACHDGLNNDGDAKADYPNDPGCDSPSDNDETDDCPSGPNCPACGNGLDDDTDGLFDYPFDDACLSAASRSESCSSSEPIATLTMGVTTGTTLNASNDMDPSCGSSSGSGPDLLYQLDLPKLDSLEIDTPNSFDTIFQLFPGSCGAAALTCTDFPPATLNNLAAGTYYLNLDGWSSSSLGAFEIDIAGVIASGGRCDGDLALSGALTCKTGTTCTAGTCQ